VGASVGSLISHLYRLEWKWVLDINFDSAVLRYEWSDDGMIDLKRRRREPTGSAYSVAVLGGGDDTEKRALVRATLSEVTIR
jgi:hypothetical protein